MSSNEGVYVGQPMTDEQRKAIAQEYLIRVDQGRDFLSMFDDHARVYFPKWGVAAGREQFTKLFEDLFGILRSVSHHDAYFNYVVQGDMVVLEGTTSGVTADGVDWCAGISHAGRFCDVFEIRDFKIHRLYIYLDPDYAGHDTQRYPWLARQA
jgi:hypothetical protein